MLLLGVAGSPDVLRARLAARHTRYVQHATAHQHARVVALSNDVHSCLREIANADVEFVFNLPLVLAHDEGTDLETAVAAAAAVTQDHIDRFTRGYHDAVPELPPSARAHLEGVALWTQGTFDRLGDCGRCTAYWDTKSSSQRMRFLEYRGLKHRSNSRAHPGHWRSSRSRHDHMSRRVSHQTPEPR
ncbi:hypothetical protein ACGFYP_28690 [Streptomyces sp. NPDC048370]|uniref:terpene synthase family protein n=1 Tax=Streptomyces sp. NPDC048370 TaxID=3365540 RepID=UPI003710FAF8